MIGLLQTGLWMLIGGFRGLLGACVMCGSRSVHKHGGETWCGGCGRWTP